MLFDTGVSRLEDDVTNTVNANGVSMSNTLTLLDRMKSEIPEVESTNPLIARCSNLLRPSHGDLDGETANDQLSAVLWVRDRKEPASPVSRKNPAGIVPVWSDINISNRLISLLQISQPARQSTGLVSE